MRRRRKSPVPHTVQSYRRGNGRPNPPLVFKRRITKERFPKTFTSDEQKVAWDKKLASEDELYRKLRARRYAPRETVTEDITDMEDRRGDLLKKPPWTKRGFGQVSYYFGRTLHSIVEAKKPDLVVETGVAMGCSSSYILSALKKNKRGRLVSVDVEPRAGEIISKDLRKRWTFHVGKSQSVLPRRKNLKDIDIFFHDSDHSYKNMMWEFNWAYPRVKKGGLIISDDLSWNNSMFDFARKHNEKVHFIRTSKSRAKAGVIIKSH